MVKSKPFPPIMVCAWPDTAPGLTIGSARSTTMGDLQGSRQKADTGEAARAARRPAVRRADILICCMRCVIDLRRGVGELAVPEGVAEVIKKDLTKDWRYDGTAQGIKNGWRESRTLKPITNVVKEQKKDVNNNERVYQGLGDGDRLYTNLQGALYFAESCHLRSR